MQRSGASSCPRRSGRSARPAHPHRRAATRRRPRRQARIGQPRRRARSARSYVVDPRYASITRLSARTSAGVPSAMTRPRSRTTTRSASDPTNFMSCSTRICVRPRSRSVFMASREPVLLGRTQPGGGLVEQEQPGPLGEGAGDREKTELTDRKRRRGGVRVIGEPHELERRARFVFHHPFLAPLPGRSQHPLDESGARPGVAADGRVAEHIEVLENAGGLEADRNPRAGTAVRGPVRDRRFPPRRCVLRRRAGNPTCSRAASTCPRRSGRSGRSETPRRSRSGRRRPRRPRRTAS